MLGEALLGPSQEVQKCPPRSPSSGLLDDLHSKEMSGRPSSMIPLASSCSRMPDKASKVRILGCQDGVFSQSEIGFSPLVSLLQKGEERVWGIRFGFDIWESFSPTHRVTRWLSEPLGTAPQWVSYLVSRISGSATHAGNNLLCPACKGGLHLQTPPLLRKASQL
ncbi:hypothetical protein Taro_017419, partial [Colocasia esculenta]|nr:hypothetical protein [Colocasia esculenta]